MTSGNFEESGVRLVLDISSYTRNMNKAINDSDSLDKAMERIESEAARVERALADINGSISANVTVNVTDDNLTSVESRIEDINSETPTVTVNAEDQELTDAQDKVTAIDGESASVTINANAQALERIQGQLQTIHELAVISVAFNVIGDPGALLQNIPGFDAIMDIDQAVRTLDASIGVSIPNAERLINDLYNEGFGESRNEIASTLGILHNLGIENEQALANTAEQAFATQEAIAGIGHEAPSVEQLVKMSNSLVNLGLADSFQDSMDIIVSGFQSGIGISGDFLGDLGEFAPTFATMGFTAEQMLATLDTGLSGGVDNISRMSEGLISFNELASAADENFVATLNTIDQVAGTDLGSQLDLYQAGEMTGADFMSGVLDAARSYSESEGVTEAQGILGNLFGGTASNIGAQALLNIDPNAPIFDDIEGRAQDTAETVRNSLDEIWQQTSNTLETALMTALNNAFNIRGRLDDFKAQLKTFTDEIQSGTALGEAIEISFGLEGIDTALTNLERVFGNLAIIFLEIASDVGAVLGKDVSGLDAQVAKMAEQQLAFDLQIANPEEFGGLVSMAIERGADSDAIGRAYGTAIQEALDAGNIQVAAQLAQEISGASDDTLNISGVDVQRSRLTMGGNLSAETVAAAEEAGKQARAAFFTAMQSGEIGDALNLAAALDDPAMISQASQAANELFLAAQEALDNYDFSTASLIANQLNDPTLKAQAEELGNFLRDQANLALAEGDLVGAKQLAADLGDPELMAALEAYKNNTRTSATDASRAVEISEEDIRHALSRQGDDLEEQKPQWVQWSENAINQVNLVGERIAYVSEQMMGLNNNLATDTNSSGSGTTGQGGMASGGTIGAGTSSWVGEEGMEMFTAPRPGAIINAASSSLLEHYLSELAGGGNTYNYNNYITVSQSTSVQNRAQADALGYRYGKALRGFGG